MATTKTNTVLDRLMKIQRGLVDMEALARILSAGVGDTAGQGGAWGTADIISRGAADMQGELDVLIDELKAA